MPEHLTFSEHLTAAQFDSPIKETFLGQAHIAGTGPAGATCRECVFWHCWKKQRRTPTGEERPPIAVPPGYYGKKHTKEPLGIKKAFCNKPILNKAKRLIPHKAKACRLFEPAENPLPAVRVEQ